MRYKAISDNYGKNAKRNSVITLAIAFALNIILLLLFLNQLDKPSFELLPIIFMVIGYSIFAFPNIMVFAASSVHKNNVKLIGRDRYITMNKETISLEDNIDGRSFERIYDWEDIKRIVVRDKTPYPKFNKTKTHTIAFIIDDKKHNRFLYRGSYGTRKRIEYLDSFFYVMYDKDMLNEIEQYWHGTVEELNRKPV